MRPPARALHDRAHEGPQHAGVPRAVARDEILRGVYHADPEKVAEAILAKVPKLILQ